MQGPSIAAIKRNRARTIAKLATRSYYLHKRARDDEMYELIAAEFTKLGGVYIKFLQGGLLHSRKLQKQQNPNRLDIFEDLASEPINIVEFLRHELPPEKIAQISLIQPEPFAAGSFGQVYYGQLSDGSPIIVKMLRPMIRELLLFDLKLLNRFSKQFFVKLYRNMNVQLNEAIQDFQNATLRETDYVHEANFAAELYENYKNHPSIRIPRTYLGLCTPNIIVQEYVGGISIAQLLKLKDQGVDPVAYVREQLGSDLDTQLEAYGYENTMDIFRAKRIQGDPHPGNIRLLPNNQVGIIDFGISANAPQEKAAFFGILNAYDQMFKGSQKINDLFEQGLRFFISDLYRSLIKLGSVIGREQNQNYVKELSDIAAEVFVQVTGTDIIHADLNQEQSVLVIINKIVNSGNRFGLVMKLEATEILRAMQTYTGLISNLGRYDKVVPNIMHRVVQDVRAYYPESITEPGDHLGVSEAFEIVTRWLERVATRDPLLFRKLMEKVRINTEAQTIDIVKDTEQVHV